MKQINQGGTSQIYDGILYHQECIVKSSFLSNELIKEKYILQKISHPNIIQLLGSIENLQTPNLNIKMGLVFPQYKCSLFDYLIVQKQKLSLNQKISLLKQILSAIELIHQNQIIHKDIKIQNIMIEYVNNQEQIKVILIDFGNSQEFNDPQNFSGTPKYCPPEILLKKFYNYKVDIFMYGCLIWEIMKEQLILNNIDNSDVKEAMYSISYQGIEDWQELIEKCREQNAEKRIEIHDIWYYFD